MESMLVEWYGINEQEFLDFFKEKLKTRLENDDSFGLDILYILEYGSAIELFNFLVNSESFEEFLVEIK